MNTSCKCKARACRGEGELEELDEARRCVQLSHVCSTSNVSLNLGSYTSLTPFS